MSISRANLPDAVEVAVSQVESRRQSNATEKSPDQEPKVETMSIRSRPAPRANAPPPIIVPALGADVQADLPSNPVPTTPAHYLEQDLPPQTNFHPAVDASLSTQDLKRKRQCVEEGLPAPTSSTSMAYYNSPIFVGSQPFMTESYEDLQAFHSHMVPTTGPEVFGESLDPSMFPYYLDH